MNYDDIPINLPGGTRLTTLTVAPEFESYEPILQRAVMILLTSARPEMTLDGMTLSQNISRSNSNITHRATLLSSFYANALKAALNEESEDVASVEITISSEGAAVEVNINITKIDATVVTGKFTI